MGRYESEVVQCAYFSNRIIAGQDCSFNVDDYRDIYRTIPPQVNDSVIYHGCYLRGSCATFAGQEPAINLRTPISDIDYIRMVSCDAQPFYTVTYPYISQASRRVKVDVLALPDQALEDEMKDPKRLFLQSRYLHVGAAIDPESEEAYQQRKRAVMVNLIARLPGYQPKQDVLYATPSGIAKMLVELDITGEPWRITSYRDAFVRTDHRDRNMQHFMTHIQRALDQLLSEDRARIVSRLGANTKEDVYEIDECDVKFPLTKINRWKLTACFIREQQALKQTTIGFKPSKDYYQRVMYKWREVLIDALKPRKIDQVIG